MYVSGFSKTTTPDDILNHFDPKGNRIRDIVMKDRFCFIVFEKHEYAVRAVKDYNNTYFGNLILRCEKSCKY